MPQQKKSKVFISHATKDKPVVDSFFDLLNLGLQLNPNDVFCTSLEGLGIPSGKNFVEYIKSEILEPQLVILMLSQNYFDSEFCLCELGASWALSTEILPVLIPPADYEDLKAVLGNVHVRKLNSASDLSEIRDELVSLLDLEQSTARWDAKKRNFLDGLDELCENLPSPEKVDVSKLREAEERYNSSVVELQKAFHDLESLQMKYEELKGLKNSEEVAEIERKYSSTEEHFAELCDNAQSALNNLSDICKEITFCELTDSTFTLPDKFYEKDKWAELRSAKEYDEIFEPSSEDFTLNYENPRVSDAVEELSKVETFIDELIQSDNEFLESYQKEYGHRLLFRNRHFWDKHLF